MERTSGRAGLGKAMHPRPFLARLRTRPITSQRCTINNSFDFRWTQGRSTGDWLVSEEGEQATRVWFTGRGHLLVLIPDCFVCFTHKPPSSALASCNGMKTIKSLWTNKFFLPLPWCDINTSTSKQKCTLK